jgi:glucose-1-phosphate thymidylyltransferase
LLSLGNKPLISHIIENILETDITDIIIIVGYEKDMVIDFIQSTYGDVCNFTFIEQKTRRGLGHAIYSSKDYLDGTPILIALGDSLYENSFSLMLKEYNQHPKWDGAIAVKSVSNPQAYGVVTTDDNTKIVKNLEEKPINPTSSLAITGVYFIRDSLKLKDALEELISSDQIGAGKEFQLTDALQKMVKNGLILGTISSGRWFDCGKKGSLLDAHKYVLSKSETSTVRSKLDNSIIIPPVSIQEECKISNSIIGPNVSIDRGTVVEKSILSSSIIGNNSRIYNTSIHDSLIGDRVELVGRGYDLNIGDHSKVQFF